MKFLFWLCLVLLIIGGLNWGLIGLFNVNLVAAVFGKMTLLSRLIYILVGVAAVLMIIVKMHHVTKEG